MTVGDEVPDFSAETDQGAFSLAAHRGRKVVIYFYPKDQTPGCITESCGFRDLKAELEAAGALIVGVSKDSLKSHANFVAKQSLNFPLISDPELVVHGVFGAWVEKNYGKTYMGTERCTFLIDAEGVLAQEWRKVRVKGHVDAVLEAARAL